LINQTSHTKKALAGALAISRASLYYVSRQLPKDWDMKRRIEEVLSEHPSYGYRRVALDLAPKQKTLSAGDASI